MEGKEGNEDEKIEEKKAMEKEKEKMKKKKEKDEGK